MGLLLPLGLCTLALCCGAVSLPQQALGPSPLLSRGCNDSGVLAVTGFALQDINRDRKDGYVLSLNRVHNAWEHRQDDLGSLFYLTLDVLETDCHVLSKKAWRDCRVRSLHGLVSACFHKLVRALGKQPGAFFLQGEIAQGLPSFTSPSL
ncbi:PREDICTED: fetuin-B-like [Propithecus coquereli]|uniref:fetuin-B-like n=1 Tax=Propithecus coquereli TaxID=379532 RepID=UPI00063FC7E3|nr:PREDICTED: fetuin-B-like [Propithecus coquereli]